MNSQGIWDTRGRHPLRASAGPAPIMGVCRVYFFISEGLCPLFIKGPVPFYINGDDPARPRFLDGVQFETSIKIETESEGDLPCGGANVSVAAYPVAKSHALRGYCSPLYVRCVEWRDVERGRLEPSEAPFATSRRRISLSAIIKFLRGILFVWRVACSGDDRCGVLSMW